MLLERIAAEIRTQGPVSFARFMEIALHDPDHGYYHAGNPFGPPGDYLTAADLGDGFGACVARQLVELDDLLGRPSPFTVIEFGAGRGLTAKDIAVTLRAASPDLAGRLRYVMVERSSSLRAAAARNAPWAQVVEPSRLQPAEAGCALAVELFDALPVHRLRRRQGELREVLVGLREWGELCEVEAAPAPAVLRLAERYGAAAAEGDEAEVCAEVSGQIDVMSHALRRGAWIVADYGDRADALYAPARRRGTLLAYRGHRLSERLLDHPGRQDLTAWVNFSHVEDEGRRAGLEVLGLTTQDRFLVANGLLSTFLDDEASWRSPRRVKARLQAKTLMHPEAMGRRFKVLVLGRGLPPDARLRGLADPYAWLPPAASGG